MASRQTNYRVHSPVPRLRIVAGWADLSTFAVDAFDDRVFRSATRPTTGTWEFVLKQKFWEVVSLSAIVEAVGSTAEVMDVTVEAIADPKSTGADEVKVTLVTRDPAGQRFSPTKNRMWVTVYATDFPGTTAKLGI